MGVCDGKFAILEVADKYLKQETPVAAGTIDMAVVKARAKMLLTIDSSLFA